VLVKFRQTVRNIGCLINPMAALIDRATLPRPITRRMRQRAFVILNPCQIAGTIRRTCRSGNSSRPRRAAVHRHARPSSSRAVSAHPSSRSRSCAPLKKISPGFPRPILIRRAAYIRPCCHRGFISSRRSPLSNLPTVALTPPVRFAWTGSHLPVPPLSGFFFHNRDVSVGLIGYRFPASHKAGQDRGFGSALCQQHETVTFIGLGSAPICAVHCSSPS
jgi:hypothetical protein